MHVQCGQVCMPELWVQGTWIHVTWSLGFSLSLTMRKTMCQIVNILFWPSWVNECWSCVPLSHLFKRTKLLVLEFQLDQKKISALIFCIVGLKVNLKDHLPWIWVNDLKVDTPIGVKNPTTRNHFRALMSIHMSVHMSVNKSVHMSTHMFRHISRHISRHMPAQILCTHV